MTNKTTVSRDRKNIQVQVRMEPDLLTLLDRHVAQIRAQFPGAAITRAGAVRTFVMAGLGAKVSTA